MKTTLPGVFVLSVALVGCSGETVTTNGAVNGTTTTAAVANMYCPIMLSEVTPDGGTTTFNGKTIGFCCESCIDEFNALSDEEKNAALKKAEEEGPKQSGSDAHDHGNHSHGHGESTDGDAAANTSGEEASSDNE